MNFKDLKVKNKITVAVIGIAILASISGIVSAFMMSGIQKQYDNALEKFGFAQGDVGMVLSSLVMPSSAKYSAWIGDYHRVGCREGVDCDQSERWGAVYEYVVVFVGHR